MGGGGEGGGGGTKVGMTVSVNTLFPFFNHLDNSTKVIRGEGDPGLMLLMTLTEGLETFAKALFR